MREISSRTFMSRKQLIERELEKEGSSKKKGSLKREGVSKERELGFRGCFSGKIGEFRRVERFVELVETVI